MRNDDLVAMAVLGAITAFSIFLALRRRDLNPDGGPRESPPPRRSAAVPLVAWVALRALLTCGAVTAAGFLLLFALQFGGLVLAVALACAWRRPGWEPAQDTHGTGRFAESGRDLRPAGMLGGRGLVLAGALDGEGPRGLGAALRDLLAWPPPSHAAPAWACSAGRAAAAS